MRRGLFKTLAVSGSTTSVEIMGKQFDVKPEGFKVQIPLGVHRMSGERAAQFVATYFPSGQRIAFGHTEMQAVQNAQKKLEQLGEEIATKYYGKQEVINTVLESPFQGKRA